MSYPLGNFHTAGATSKYPADDPAQGIPFDYHTDNQGFSRPMIPIPERPQGVVWIDGLCTADDQGVEKLVSRYSRRKGLDLEYEQGIAVFNDDKAIFEPLKQLALKESWRRPFGQTTIVEEDGKRWLLFANPTPQRASFGQT